MPAATRPAPAAGAALAQPAAPATRPAPAAAPSSDIAGRIAADPVGFIREVAARTAALQQYRLIFHRQERWGLPPKLGETEEIRAAFRREPFSVKFEWDDPRAAYYESVYVAGRNKNQLIIRERKGALPFLPPQVRAVDTMFPVKLGKSKNPITDFGLDRIMQRSLLPFENPEIARAMTVRYEGLVTVEPTGVRAHVLRIDRPKTAGLAYTRQDLFFDATTLLPAGTDLYLPSGDLDARYRYSRVKTDVQLTDADFELAEKGK